MRAPVKELFPMNLIFSLGMSGKRPLATALLKTGNRYLEGMPPDLLPQFSAHPFNIREVVLKGR